MDLLLAFIVLELKGALDVNIVYISTVSIRPNLFIGAIKGCEGGSV